MVRCRNLYSQYGGKLLLGLSMYVPLSNVCVLDTHTQMYGMAVAKKLENNRNIFKQKFFRQV